MSEADPTALVEHLRRANRRWRVLAALRAADEASRAQQEARREAERHRAEVERARDEARRALYAANIWLATQEWERDGAGGDPKP